jgi:cytochrome c biogenesis protein CcdA
MNHANSGNCDFSTRNILIIMSFALVITIYLVFATYIIITLTQIPHKSTDIYTAYIGLGLILLYLLNVIRDYIEYNICNNKKRRKHEKRYRHHNQ